MDEALDSERGIRLTFKARNAAFRFLSRCNSFRRLDREENAKIYLEPAHTLHGRSPYDILAMRCDGAAVLIRKISEDVSAEKELL